MGTADGLLCNYTPIEWTYKLGGPDSDDLTMVSKYK